MYDGGVEVSVINAMKNTPNGNLPSLVSPMSNQAPVLFPTTSQNITGYGFQPPRIHCLKKVLGIAGRFRSFPFKMQKPEAPKKIDKKKWRWWRHFLLLFKFPKRKTPATEVTGRRNCHAVSVYTVDSWSSGGTGSYRMGSEIPYINLRELNVENGHASNSASATARPIYLVT